MTPCPPPADARWLEVSWAMVFIYNIDIEWAGDSLYEGGDVNHTIPPPKF